MDGTCCKSRKGLSIVSSRHQPEHGADSAEAWQPRPFQVLVCDRFDEDDRRWITVAAAIGPNDARSQIRTLYPEVSVLTVEEAS